MFKKYKGLIVKLIISIVIAISIVMIYAFVEPIRAVTNLLIISIVIAYTLKPLRNYFCEKLHISYKKSSCCYIRTWLQFPLPEGLYSPAGPSLYLNAVPEHALQSSYPSFPLGDWSDTQH